MNPSAIFHAVAAAAPIDSAAKRVTGKGTHWNPSLTRNQGGFQTPLDAPPPADVMPSGMEDIKGQRRGRMVAFQYQGRSQKGRHLWLMRCDCGLFELRQAAKWTASNGVDCCQRCDEAHHVRTGSYLAQLRPAKPQKEVAA